AALRVASECGFDRRFGMGVLAILPLTAFYLLMGSNRGGMQDPFSSAGEPSGPGVFFAIAFIPITLHAALSASERWRGAWIFFATPASHARITVAGELF